MHDVRLQRVITTWVFLMRKKKKPPQTQVQQTTVKVLTPTDLQAVQCAGGGGRKAKCETGRGCSGGG